MAFKFAVLVALILALTVADPQFGGFGGLGGGSNNKGSGGSGAPSGFGSGLGSLNPAALAQETLEYGPKIRELVEVVTLTLTEMGQIALADHSEIGARIVDILQIEIASANKVLVDWTARAARVRRAVDDSGKTAYNEVGEILVDSNKKIATDKGKLSPEAQDKIDAAHAKGVAKCDADPCKNDKAIKNKTKGAQRQG